MIAEVILTVPLMDTFSYLIPELIQHACVPGVRVVVPFGKRKKMSGLVAGIRQPEGKETGLKEIESVLDESPIVNETALLFWKWMADYYVCSPGDVYKAALPAGLKLESETRLALHEGFDGGVLLRGKEREVYEALFETSSLTIRELEKRLHVSYLVPVIKRLEDKAAVQIDENVISSYKAKSEKMIHLSEGFQMENQLNEILNELERAPKQKSMLMRFLALAGGEDGRYDRPVKRRLLLKEGKQSVQLKALLDKGILNESVLEINRTPGGQNARKPLKELVPFQKKALIEIELLFAKKQVVFLHGVTSSGKTELYAHLASEAMKEGKQVLYLVPEIALSTQLTDRLKKYFGDDLVVYHSRLTANERVDIWKKMASGKGIKMVVGPRSAQFLPFNNLGFIIIDEEHETSYKQDQPNPRYHGRDSAIMLGVLHKAKVLLGSATPSLETFHNSKTGKYAYVRLDQRFGDMPLPKMQVVDMGNAYKKNRVRGHFSFELIAGIREALQNGQQVILFLNRRGYAPYVECKSCGWVLMCPHCDVSLTLHKFRHEMRCHYCGHSQAVPDTCGSCGNEVMMEKGIGTEQLEEEVRDLFPGAKPARMDFDTTRGKNKFAEIFDAFEEGRIDILIGTQMVTKGLDFDNVALVGIVQADSMLYFSDFRASERSFQMIEQVAGRSGRKGSQGLVIIQTFQADHPVIQRALTQTQHAFYEQELEERRLFNYPPFSHIIVITLRHLFKKNVHEAAHMMAHALREKFKDGVLGPEPPVMSRVKNQYQERIFIKADKTSNQTDVKKRILRLGERIRAYDKRFASLGVFIDVDPV